MFQNENTPYVIVKDQKGQPPRRPAHEILVGLMKRYHCNVWASSCGQYLVDDQHEPHDVDSLLGELAWKKIRLVGGTESDHRAAVKALLGSPQLFRPLRGAR